jgi:hypothetical protein
LKAEAKWEKKQAERARKENGRQRHERLEAEKAALLAATPSSGFADQAMIAASISHQERQLMENIRRKSTAIGQVALKAVHAAALIQALRAYALMLDRANEQATSLQHAGQRYSTMLVDVNKKLREFSLGDVVVDTTAHDAHN